MKERGGLKAHIFRFSHVSLGMSRAWPSSSSFQKEFLRVVLFSICLPCTLVHVVSGGPASRWTLHRLFPIHTSTHYLWDDRVCVRERVCVAAKRAWLTLPCESENEWKPQWKKQDGGRWSEKPLCPTHWHSSSPASIEHREINVACALSGKKERSKTGGILLQPGDSFYLLTAPLFKPLSFAVCPVSSPLWLSLNNVFGLSDYC